VSAERLRLQGGPGAVAVRFRGALSLPLWRVAGRAVVRFREQAAPQGRRLAWEEMEGSSPAGALAGAWLVTEPQPGSPFCDLSYEAQLRPRPGCAALPGATARRLLAEAAAGALRAAASAAEAAARAAAGPGWLEAPQPSSSAASTDGNADGFGARELWGAAALPRRQWAPPDYLGLQSVSLPQPPPPSPPPPPPPPPPAAGTGLQEIHLRRLDAGEALHRRAVASCACAAPLDFAWAALWEWEQHGDFLPGCVLAQADPPATPGRARVRYLVAHAQPYIAMHGSLTLELLAQRGGGPAAAGGPPPGARALQFRAVQPSAPPGAEGLLLRGKWLLSPDLGAEEEEEAEAGGGAEAEAAAAAATRCFLKLAIEARCALPPGQAKRWAAAEARADAPLSDRAVYEHLPAALEAVRRRAEALWAASREEGGDAALRACAMRAAAARFAAAPRAQGAAALAANPAALRAALLALGLAGDGRMPTRDELRAVAAAQPAAYVAESAIGAAGGFAAAAAATGLGLSPERRARKPRGYWDSLENVSREMRSFVAEQGLDPGVLPSKAAMLAAGRFDLAKLPERWGGAPGLAAELGLRYAGRLVRAAPDPQAEGWEGSEKDSDGSLWLPDWRGGRS